jgi:tetratricopeptide (TPR) repeat protein
VFRLVIACLLLCSSIHGYSSYWDDDDFEDDEGFVSILPNQVTYCGMTIECNRGCGHSTSDQTFSDISSLLRGAISEVFDGFSSPIYLGWGPELNNKPFPFHPWRSKWPLAYEVYDWQKTRGFYLHKPLKREYSFASHSKFLELAFALREDVQFYFFNVYSQQTKFYKSTLFRVEKMKKEGEYRNIQFTEDGQLELYDGWTSQTKSINDFCQSLKNGIDTLEKCIDFDLKKYERKKKLIEEAIQEIDGKFRRMFIRCLENHQPEGIAFKGALEKIIGQDFYEAIGPINWLVEIAEKHRIQNELLAKLYLLKGQIQSEYGLYAEAVIGLTIAIHKNPKMKKAYFERAAAYFELGQFDRSIEDYLASENRPTYFEVPTQFGLGVTAGILVGAKDSSIEFIPTMLGTAQGLGAGIWALIKNPVAASQEFISAAIEYIEYIKSHSTYEIIQDMVPELRELLQNYERLDDYQKGKLIGRVVGNYGMDILLTKQSFLALKSYQKLKKANKALTLDALASSGKSQVILAETEKRWSHIHIERIRSGEVKISEAKQGKHIVGHRNYKVLIEGGRNPSIFSHPDPQKLLMEYGGMGIKASDSLETVTGIASYKEIVDFKQIIGYAVDEQTKVKMATTLGKIHYAKDGVHIVPFIKK